MKKANTFANLPAAKQQAVLQAATREFARQGYSKASMNVVVREAGISKGSLYQYFANKEALFHFVFAEFHQTVKAMVKELAWQEDIFLLFAEVMRAGVRFVDLYPEYFQIYLKVLFDEDVPGRHNLISQVRLFSADYFGPICQAAQERGELRGDMSVGTVIFLFDAAMDRFLQVYTQHQIDLEPEVMITELTALLKQGMASK